MATVKKYLYLGMPSYRGQFYEFPKVWTGKSWMDVEDIESWDMNVDEISEETFRQKLKEMGGTYPG
jgi:hypothetical protein